MVETSYATRISIDLGRLLWDERQVVRQVATQMPSENARLHEGHLRQSQVLIQERVVEVLLLPLLVRFDDELPSRVGEFDRAAFPLDKMFRGDLLPVNQCD